MKKPPKWTRGSEWLRWDPHIHAPGTLMNDQYAGDWTGYFNAIASADPAPVALGITDYFTLAGYREFRNQRPPGSLPAVQMVFPNVELRLTTETRRGHAINLHLLVSPDDRRHVEKFEERLSHVRFEYGPTHFPCSDRGLIDLGRAFRNDETLAEAAAMSIGAGQFKAEFREILELFDDGWFRDNVLMAVAAGQDGLGGLSQDSQWAAVRENIGRASDIIFSGSENERSFWLKPGGTLPRRPCLHGSDAHSLAKVLKPDEARLCWIRGDATFESLKQAVIEPERRVFIGRTPPRGASEGYVMSDLVLSGASWIENDQLSFNDGLVTIIGAKGSGKTALADLLALFAGADEPAPGNASFIRKARHLLGGLKGVLTWGDRTSQTAVAQPQPQPSTEPRVQYLSQQFVERLSAPEELGEPLVEEIERVVFHAIPEEKRMQATSFGELRDLLLEDARASQAFHRGTITSLTRAVAAEIDLKRSIPSRQKKVEEAERERKGLQKDIASIPAAASAEKAKVHTDAANALQALQQANAVKERRAKDLSLLAGEVRRQLLAADQSWGQLKVTYPDLIDDTTWTALRLRLDPAGLQRLADLEAEARKEAEALQDQGLPSVARPSATASKPAGLEQLKARLEQAVKELGLDRTNATRKVDLERRLVGVKATEEQARRELANALGAEARQKEAHEKRLEAYDAVFQTLSQEEDELERLYAPLLGRLTGSKLAFTVQRVVGLKAWVKKGEELLDLRTAPFSQQGYLEEQARSLLLKAWLTGTPTEVRAAMRAFLEKVAGDALKSLVQSASPMDLGEWLFSTNHIRVRYGIEYEGVEISNLSPGTRGVVLLTLYLGLDEWDPRPLVIDQPEENLDPSSIYDDLVPWFRLAAKRRQIVMVTHNANLVVNTDSDQVIVARAKRDKPQGLPHVTYEAGGLEDPDIREAVCSLLEGGKEAFRLRGERYKLNVRA
ncbi:MAG: TrlF family AAA-like ATPase [Chloroflexota bacterium]